MYLHIRILILIQVSNQFSIVHYYELHDSIIVHYLRLVTDAYEKAHFILDTVDEILFIRVFI